MVKVFDTLSHMYKLVQRKRGSKLIALTVITLVIFIIILVLLLPPITQQPLGEFFQPIFSISENFSLALISVAEDFFKSASANFILNSVSDVSKPSSPNFSLITLPLATEFLVTIPCIDPDGLNISLKGISSGKLGSGQGTFGDSCINSTHILEYSCENNTLIENILQCTGDTVCASGACIIPQPVCNNNKIEVNEICDGISLGKSCTELGYSGGSLRCSANCQSFDTSGCSQPPPVLGSVSFGSGGGGAGGGITGGQSSVTSVSKTSASISILDAKKDESVFWIINQPETYTLISINMTLVNDIKNVEILTNLLDRFSPQLFGVVYQYLEINVSKQTNVSEVQLEFGINNSWIEKNNIKPDSISAYRFVDSWTKLLTKEVAKDQNFTYFVAVSPGLSVFSIAGEQLKCPTCPSSTDWSVCIDKSQTKTEYICSQETNFTCQSKVSTRNCCSTCPEFGEWSACINGTQTRNEFYCGQETDYECEQRSATRSCVIPTPRIVEKVKPPQPILPFEFVILVPVLGLVLVGGYLGFRKIKEKREVEKLVEKVKPPELVEVPKEVIKVEEATPRFTKEDLEIILKSLLYEIDELSKKVGTLTPEVVHDKIEPMLEQLAESISSIRFYLSMHNLEEANRQLINLRELVRKLREEINSAK